MVPLQQLLGNACSALGQPAEQKEILERALRFKDAHYGKYHCQVPITLTNLATAFGDLGQLAEQTELLEQALRINDAHYGKDPGAITRRVRFMDRLCSTLG